MKAMNPALESRYQTADEMLADMEKFRKAMLAVRDEPVTGNVKPVGTTGEMSLESYQRGAAGLGNVSTLSGLLGVLVFIVFLGVFLWNYWLRDIFTISQRVVIPNFTGSDYETIINSKNFNELFNFTLTYEIDPDVERGVIIRQSPEAGKSYMLTEDGIDVELAISTGVMLTEIPNVVNEEYRTASTELERLGFVVEKLFEASNDITADYVISVSPSPGEMLPAGGYDLPDHQHRPSAGDGDHALPDRHSETRRGGQDQFLEPYPGVHYTRV